MKLSAHSSTSGLETTIAWLEINTPDGNYVIQKGHAPMICLLAPNQPFIYRLKSGKQETVMVRHGIVEIDRESATILFSAP